MGLLDYADAARKKLAGLLGDMPLVQIAQGRAEMPTRAGLLGALKSIPVFSPDAGQSAYEAAINIGPMGLGKIVYHGSPHKFHKFDASKIGTGEGAQAYGHGVYLADSPAVASEYLRAGRDVGFSNFDDVGRLADKAFAQAKGDKSAAMKILDDAMATTKGDSKRMNLALAKKSIEEGTQKTGIYKADLPDEWIPKMLDWDKPLIEQKDILPALQKAGHGRSQSSTGMDLYTGLERTLGSQQAATEYLNSIGIPGIRYLDGGSRGKGQGSYNYVVFPGLEDQVKILERNGVPLSGLLGGK